MSEGYELAESRQKFDAIVSSCEILTLAIRDISKIAMRRGHPPKNNDMAEVLLVCEVAIRECKKAMKIDV